MADTSERSIRLARADDAGAIAAIYAPFCTDTPITFETEALSAEQMALRMASIGERFPWLVFEERGTIAAYAYAAPHHERAAYRWAVNVSVYVADDFRRRGIGAALYRSLFDVLRLQGFAYAIAGITLPNDPSVGLHESLGFKLVGVYPQVGFKLGSWRDVGWWQLSLGDLPEVPSGPMPMAEAVQQPGFAGALQIRS